MAQRIRGTAAFVVAIVILLLLVSWNTVAGVGEVRFVQPYEPRPWRFWEGRKSARHPSDIFWANAGQVLHVRPEASVDRGTAELTVRGLLVGPAGPLVARSISSSGSEDIRVGIPASGFYSLRVTSDLGAFGGKVLVRWVLR